MQRGFILMIIGIAIQVVNWTLSYEQMGKGITGNLTIIGWVIFFAGIGIRQLDKRKTAQNQPKKK